MCFFKKTCNLKKNLNISKSENTIFLFLLSLLKNNDTFIFFGIFVKRWLLFENRDVIDTYFEILLPFGKIHSFKIVPTFWCFL